MITHFSLIETAGISDADSWSFIWMTAVGITTLLLLTFKISPQTHGTERAASLESSSVGLKPWVGQRLHKRQERCESCPSWVAPGKSEFFSSLNPPVIYPFLCGPYFQLLWSLSFIIPEGRIRKKKWNEGWVSLTKKYLLKYWIFSI